MKLINLGTYGKSQIYYDKLSTQFYQRPIGKQPSWFHTIWLAPVIARQGNKGFAFLKELVTTPAVFNTCLGLAITIGLTLIGFYRSRKKLGQHLLPATSDQIKGVQAQLIKFFWRRLIVVAILILLTLVFVHYYLNSRELFFLFIASFFLWLWLYLLLDLDLFEHYRLIKRNGYQ